MGRPARKGEGGGNWVKENKRRKGRRRRGRGREKERTREGRMEGGGRGQSVEF